jgi:aspartate/methionine/tyrosine aminotransferase
MRRYFGGSASSFILTHYSDRLPWFAARNAYALLLAERRRAGASVIDLTISNPTEALADYPHAAIASAYGEIGDFTYQPAALGTLQARSAIADWSAAHKMPLAPGRIALTASTSEAYSILFKLLCNPGDEVLIPNPSYPLFEYLAKAEAVKTVPYRLAYDGAWFLDLDSVKRAISARSKAIVLVNPNNPTGSFLRKGEVDALKSLAASHGLALICDEVFMTYPTAKTADHVLSLIGHNELLSFSLNGLSKAAGMPQMKLAWIVVNGPHEEADSALEKLDLLFDNYLSVATPVQQALGSLFEIGIGIHSQIDSRLLENRAALNVFADSAVSVLPSEGGWSAILRVPAVQTEEAWISSSLLDHGVVIQPGYFYDMPQEAYLVVSLLTQPADFSTGVGRLRELVASSLNR